MSHEFESGFLFRTPAWHGLGTVVDQEVTSADALRLAGLDWTVRRADLYANINEFGIVHNAATSSLQRVPQRDALIRSTDNAILGVVSKRYEILQNTEAFAWIDALLGEGVRFESAGALAGGSRVWMLAQSGSSKILGEEFARYMLFTHSFDGKSSIRVAFTPTRVVCMNTLRLALANAQRTFVVRHTSRASEHLEEARRVLGVQSKYMSEFSADMTKLASTHMSRADWIEAPSKLFAVPNDATPRERDNIVSSQMTFARAMDADDLRDFRFSGYGLVQAAADMDSHAVSARFKHNTPALRRFRENRFASFGDEGSSPLIDRVKAYVAEVTL